MSRFGASYRFCLDLAFFFPKCSVIFFLKTDAHQRALYTGLYFIPLVFLWWDIRTKGGIISTWICMINLSLAFSLAFFTTKMKNIELSDDLFQNLLLNWGERWHDHCLLMRIVHLHTNILHFASAQTHIRCAQCMYGHWWRWKTETDNTLYHC